MSELVASSCEPQKSFLSVIERLASNPDIDVAKIEKFLDMQERILDKNAKQAFNESMSKAQSDMPTVQKDKKNRQTNSNYSAYETILRATKPIYTQHGFSVMFYEEEARSESDVRICADIMHKDGHTEKRYTDIPLDSAGIKGSINKTATHAKGSSISYGRSYLLRMIFNISTGDDDDGNGASGFPLINDSQLSQIRDLILAKNIDKKKFLKYMKVNSLEKIPAEKFPTALKALKEAKGKNNA